MNAPGNFPSIPADIRKDVRDVFMVFDVEDRWHASVCVGEADTREILAGIKDTSTVQVWRVTPGEIVRDVTSDFFSEPDTLPEPVFNHTANMRHIGAFSR